MCACYHVYRLFLIICVCCYMYIKKMNDLLKAMDPIIMNQFENISWIKKKMKHFWN